MQHAVACRFSCVVRRPFARGLCGTIALFARRGNCSRHVQRGHAGGDRTARESRCQGTVGDHRAERAHKQGVQEAAEAQAALSEGHRTEGCILHRGAQRTPRGDGRRRARHGLRHPGALANGGCVALDMVGRRGASEAQTAGGGRPLRHAAAAIGGVPRHLHQRRRL